MRKNFAMILMAFGFAVPVGWLAISETTAAEGRDPRAAATQRMPTMPSFPAMGGGGLNVNNNAANLPGGPVTPPSPPPPPPPSLPTPDPETTIDQCMNDILACVNGGALPNGINDLFNSDMRHSIMNGMFLCASQVDRCIDTVRRNGNIVYRSSSDVWIDFNSRVVQPQYFAFVMRRTGLTPNQAENTCMLLDRNVHGASFAAVGEDGRVTAEFDRQLHPFNQQAGDITRENPLGVAPGARGVDAQRGHYARWDATTGDCLVRVAAYNRDNLITNRWLLGAAGDDRAAEQWKPAGSTFSCNREFFEFGLMTTTRTVATIGVTGGTLVGAGIGAIAANRRVSDVRLRVENCNDPLFIELLNTSLEEVGMFGGVHDMPSCQAFLRDMMPLSPAAQTLQNTVNETTNAFHALQPALIVHDQTGEACGNVTGLCALMRSAEAGGLQEAQAFLATATNATIEGDTSGEKQQANVRYAQALFNMKQAQTRLDAQLAAEHISQERRALESAMARNNGIGKGWGAAIGAGAGAAAGGLATAITAFIERNQISCRVGDDLDRVAFNRSGRINSLRDFYVQWALKLPDTIMPTAQVVDCHSWRNACGTLRDLGQCANAQINFRPAGATNTRLVDSACTASGSVCIENHPVAVSHGACI